MYPRIGGKRRVTPQGLCILCGLPKADYRIEVEITHMRGDDEVIKTHWKCARGYTDNQLMLEILEYWKK
jgi:hypothetical protein